MSWCIPLSSDGRASGKLELTGKAATPNTTKHPGLETYCGEPLRLNWINEKKRGKMSPIPSSKIPDRESDNESTSKGECRPRRLQKARLAAHSGLLNRWILTGSLQFEVNGTSAISVDPMRPMRYSFTVNVIDRQPPPYTPPAQPEPRCCPRSHPICRGFCLQNLGPPSSSLASFISPNISPKNLTGGQTDSTRILAGAPSLCACVFALPSNEGVCV